MLFFLGNPLTKHIMKFPGYDSDIVGYPAAIFTANPTSPDHVVLCYKFECWQQYCMETASFGPLLRMLTGL